ncbi:hypothetical protein FO519_008936 [Halicephalobus sp. NKZ332]|nr:hypothetical protein FO519_008936 [Halicephalobus sp. NKZ332]
MKLYLFDKFYLIALIVQVTGNPRVPELVFPQRADPELLARSQKFDEESTKIPSATLSPLEKTYRRALEERRNKKLIESSAERSKRPPSRIYFAPIDGAEVLTADYMSSNAPANGVINVAVDERVKEVPKKKKQTLPVTKQGVPRKVLNCGNRTGDQENYGEGELHGISGDCGNDDSNDNTNIGYNRKQSEDALQPLTQLPTEKRFPAKQWQVPPSISATTKAPAPLQYDRRHPPSYLNNYNTRQAVFEEAVGVYQQRNNPRYSSRSIIDSENLNRSPVPIGINHPQQDERSPNFPPRNSYPQQRPEYYSRLQPPTPNLPLSVDTVLSPFQALTAAVAPGAGFFLPKISQPPQQYQPPEINIPPPPEPKGLNQGKNKFRATFAKHNDVIQPIPLPASTIDENDMDLLQPAGPKQVVLSKIPVPISNSPPIQPIRTTFGQQGGPPMLETSVAQNRPQLNPNEKLVLCCRKQQLSPSCQSLCNFDTFTDKTLVSTFLTNQCPEPQRTLAFQCATTRVDHSECCQRNGIHNYAGGQCMPFCATQIPTPPNVFSYLPCLQVFETIKNCYKEYQYTHPNIFGD